MAKKAAVVIVCAGKGVRLGGRDKASLKLEGKPLFCKSAEAFADFARIKQIVLVLQKKNFSLAKKTIKNKKVLIVQGGKERKDSVFCGLKALNEDIEVVLIHDGARPFISKQTISKVLKALDTHEAVVCGVRAADTVKLLRGNFIDKTLKREDIFLAHTPQGFRKDLIFKAYKRFGKRGLTDDSQFIELMGKKVKVIEEGSLNLKITYPKDLKLAKAIANERL